MQTQGEQFRVRATTLFFRLKGRQEEFVKNFTSSRLAVNFSPSKRTDAAEFQGHVIQV